MTCLRVLGWWGKDVTFTYGYTPPALYYYIYDLTVGKWEEQTAVSEEELTEISGRILLVTLFLSD